MTGGSGSSTRGPMRRARCVGPASCCDCSSCGRKDSAPPTWATVIRISAPPSRRTSSSPNESSPSCAPKRRSPTPPSSISPTCNGTWGSSPEEFSRRFWACRAGSHLHLASSPEAEFLDRDREAPPIVRRHRGELDPGRRALGVKTALASFVGDDFPSDYRDVLRKEGVDLTDLRSIRGALTPTAW